MTPRARTNQLLYQAELLLDIDTRDDEHREARLRAGEEGALALLELALNALLRDVSSHAQLGSHDWRELLVGETDDQPALAELQRLRSLALDGESWLGWLMLRLEALHSDQGAASTRRGLVNAQLISVSDSVGPLEEQLRGCIRAARREIASLRETSEEW